MESSIGSQTLSCPKNLRPKQKEVFDWFKEKEHLICQLPTGYGKTLAAAAAYAVLKDRGIASRVLYIVPTGIQAKQAAESFPEELKKFGITCKSIQITKSPTQALRGHWSGEVQVFVTTIQALVNSKSTVETLIELTSTESWFMVIDEHHHYGIDSVWTEKIKNIDYAASLAMSATPNRNPRVANLKNKKGGGKSLHREKMVERNYFDEPDISETYRNAAESGFVKLMNLHAYKYVVDAVLVDGRVIPYTTGDLVKEAGGDGETLDKFMTAKKMRWSPKYISPLITYPLERITNLRVSRGIRSQMLVQAMSCTHAKMVYEQIKALMPPHMSVDWVGTGQSGRSDLENDQVLKAFCPDKNDETGHRDWTLDILVNVGMAGEGLDSTDVTEVVFLTPANLVISNDQVNGRAARMMKVKGEQPIAHINVDTDSPMAKFYGRRVMDLFDSKHLEPGDEQDTVPCDECGHLFAYEQRTCPKCGAEREYEGGDENYEPSPERMVILITDVRLLNIQSGPLYDHVMTNLQGHGLGKEEAREVAIKAIDDFYERKRESNNESSILAQSKDQVNSLSSKVAGLIIKRIQQSTGMRVDKGVAGDIRYRINSRKRRKFGKVSEASKEELDAQYAWLIALEKRIFLEHGTKGFPEWLR